MVDVTMAPVFTIGKDVVVTGLLSNPHETSKIDVIMEVPVVPLRVSAEVLTDRVLGK